MPPSKLEKFFKDLARNPDAPNSLYKRYLANPRQVMKDAGLEDDVINAVMAGDLTFLNGVLQGSNIICGTLVRS